MPARANQLASHIDRFIDVRNYSAHTGESDAHLDQWFSDDLKGAMLLADVRHVLLELNAAIVDRLDASDATPTTT